MKKLLPILLLLSCPVFAGLELKQTANAIAAEMDGRRLWTYHCDPAEGKPYFHPLASSDGTVFTDFRPADHPWHRGVWFSWKYINGVNYWEEDRKTHRSKGDTRIVKIDQSVSAAKVVTVRLQLEYAPAGSDAVVLRENRTVIISPPDAQGSYQIDWTGTWTAGNKEVRLDRTPVPGEPKGKAYGGYAGWSVRMNPAMLNGCFINSSGTTNASRDQAEWNVFQAEKGGGLLFKDAPGNLRYPSTWYVAKGMPYFSPAVLYDGPYTLKAGESLTLTYSLVVCPGTLALKKAQPKCKKVVILTGANNHNWQATTPALKAILEQSGKFKVDVVTNPEQLTPGMLSGYDVLLSNWNTFGKNKPAPWSEELRKAYVNFVRNGGGHVVVHAGSSSFYDWADYQAIGLATWKGRTGHKHPHEFDVRMTDTAEPAFRSLQNFKTTDELWFRPLVHPDATVVAESFSQYTGDWEPTALTGRFGKGRCFTLLLGHNVSFMANPGFKTLLLCGTEWVSK